MWTCCRYTSLWPHHCKLLKAHLGCFAEQRLACGRCEAALQHLSEKELGLKVRFTFFLVACRCSACSLFVLYVAMTYVRVQYTLLLSLYTVQQTEHHKS